jgi:hypothetical protein
MYSFGHPLNIGVRFALYAADVIPILSRNNRKYLIMSKHKKTNFRGTFHILLKILRGKTKIFYVEDLNRFVLARNLKVAAGRFPGHTIFTHSTNLWQSLNVLLKIVLNKRFNNQSLESKK